MARGHNQQGGAGHSDIDAHVARISVDDAASGRVVIPDTELMFSAKYTKAGSDLVLTGQDGHKIVLTGYFDHAHHADLVSQGGAILPASLVAQLTASETPGQYAQAGAPAGGVVIGKVERLGGSATVQHANGTVEDLKIGDNVLQGDVVETRDGSQLGMSFLDGTAFNMGANARMVLSELSYDANSNANSAVFSLVKGSISFVAGQVAKTGDMRVDTPVATMGIRGTSVNTNIDADINGNVYSVTYSLMRDPDGHIGSFNVLDRTTGAIIGTITTTDTTFVVTPSANLGVLANQLNKTPEQIALELNVAANLFPIFLANPANFNNQPINPQDLQPKSGPHGSGGLQGGGSQQNNGSGGSGNSSGGSSGSGGNGGTGGTGSGGGTSNDNTRHNLAPSIFADVTPPHLVEAISLGSPGAPTATAHLYKADSDGVVSYNTYAMLNSGWVFLGNGIYSQLGVYGAASLNTGGATATALLAANWINLGNGIFEKVVSFGAAGNETVRISLQADSLTYALDNTKADPLRQIDHPQESFTVQVIDDNNDTASTTVYFTADGENDPPAVISTPQNHAGGVTEDGAQTAGNLVAADIVTFRDPELTDGHTASVVFKSSTSSAHLPGFTDGATHIGSFTIDGAVNEDTSDQINTATLGWKFTLPDNDPTLQSLAAGQTLTQVYTITINDGHGGTVDQDITVTITGTNDGPTIVTNSTTPAGGVTEDVAVAGGNISTSGTIGFQDLDLIDTHTASFALKTSTSNSHLPGFTDNISQIGTFALASISESNSDTANTGSVGWSFTLDDSDPTLQSLTSGQTITLVYAVTITDNNGAAVTQDVTITITGANDSPNDSPTIVSGLTTATGAVTEDTLVVSDHVATSGTITFQDVDLIDTHTAAFVLKSSDANADLPGFGEGVGSSVANIGTFALTSVSEDNTDTSNLGSVGWSFTLDNNNPVLQSLAAGQTITQIYTVTIKDNNNAPVTQDVTVTITGVNDGPTIVAGLVTTPTGGVTEDTTIVSGNVATSGTITFQDVDLIDTHTASFVLKSTDANADLPGFSEGVGSSVANIGTFALTGVNENSSDTTNTGSFGWTFTLDNNSSVLQSLAAGQTITQIYTVTIKDNNNAPVTQDVTVTITGVNDGPTIVVGSTAAAGAVVEDTGVTAGNVATSGTITFQDVDLIDTHTASFVLKSSDADANLPGFSEGVGSSVANIGTFALTGVSENTSDTVSTGSFGWTFTLDNNDPVLQSLAAGQTITQVYTVTILDNNNAPVTQDVTVTITGTNDAPVVATADVTGAVTEQGTPAGNLTDTGTIAFSDVDLIDTHSVLASITASSGALGSLTASVTTDTTNGTGGVITWNYSVADADVEYLAAGETKVETFTITLDDGHDGKVDRTISVTITGTNDAPKITVGGADSAAAGLTETNAPLSTNGTLSVSDVDVTNTVAASVYDLSLGGTGLASKPVGLTLADLKAMLSVDVGNVIDNSHTTGTIHWAFASTPQAFDFLATNETLVLTYTVRATDSDISHATADQAVTITITGTNDAPTINLTPDIARIALPAGLGVDPDAHYAYAPVISNDGRYVVFDTAETQPADDNGPELGGDVYLHDRLTGTTIALDDAAHLASPRAGEVYSGFAINSDGSLVVFKGSLTVPDTVGSHVDTVVYVYNRAQDTTTVLTPSNSSTPFLINDQARINASNLIVFTHDDHGPGGPSPHVMVTDTAGHVLSNITASSLGITDPSVNLQTADISGNGRYLTFWATPQDSNGVPDSNQSATLYTYDRVSQTGLTIATTTATDNDWWASMSNDGRYVVFQSDANIGSDGNGYNDIFLWDRSNGPNGSITSITGDASADGASLRPTISPDGRYITFSSAAGNLVPGDTNGVSDTFVYDRVAGTFTLLSVAADGTQGDANSDLASDINYGGAFAVFGSSASNLTAAGTDGLLSSAFIVDLLAGTRGIVTEDSTAPDTSAPPPAGPVLISTHGAIKFADADLTDAHTATLIGTVAIDTSHASGFTVAPGGLGTFTPSIVETTTDTDPNGKIAWTFSVDNSLVQGLGAGQYVTQTYTVQLGDGHGGTTTQQVLIAIVGTNDAPVVVTSTTTGNVVAEGALTANGQLNATDADVSDTPAWNIVGTPAVSGHSIQQGIYGALDVDLSGAWTYTLAGSQTNVKQLTGGETVQDHFNVQVSDGHGGFASQAVDVTVVGANDAPVVDAHSGSLSYTENDAPSVIDAAVTVSDIDTTALASATVKITGNLHAGEDVLAFVNNSAANFGDIDGTYTAGSGELVLQSASGTATMAQWQHAMQAVTYFNSSDNPSGDTRTISYSADDGQSAHNLSNVVTATVSVTPVNDAPTLDLDTGTSGNDFSRSTDIGAAPVAVTGPVHIADVDNSTLASAKLVLNNGSAGDFVTVGGSSNSNGTLANGIGWAVSGTAGDTQDPLTVTLTGVHALADYEAALGQVDFGTSGSSGNRQVAINVNDGLTDSDIATTTLTVTSTRIIDLGAGSGSLDQNLIALDDGGFLVSYYSPVAQGYVAQLYDGAHQAVGTPYTLPIYQGGNYRLTALDNGDFAVVWFDYNLNGMSNADVAAQKFHIAQDGSITPGQLYTVSAAGMGQIAPSIAATANGNFDVVYEDMGSWNFFIWHSTDQTTEVVPVGYTGTYQGPSTAAVGSTELVALARLSDNSTVSVYNAGMSYTYTNGSGSPATDPTLYIRHGNDAPIAVVSKNGENGSPTNPAVNNAEPDHGSIFAFSGPGLAENDHAVVFWTQHDATFSAYEHYFARVMTDGTLGSIIDIAAPTSAGEPQFIKATNLADGQGFMVAYIENNGSTWEILGKSFAWDGSVITAEHPLVSGINPTSAFTLDTLSDGTIALSYQVAMTPMPPMTPPHSYVVLFPPTTDVVHPPVAYDASVSTNEDSAISSVVPTATDADNNFDHYVLDHQMSQGSLTFNTVDGSYTYDPSGAFDSLAVGQTANVSFTYHAVDATGSNSAPKSVSFQIDGVNDAPVINTDGVFASGDLASGGTLKGLSIGDIDAHSDALAFSASASQGTASPTSLSDMLANLNATLSQGVAYTPDGSAPAADTITLTVDDNHGGTDTVNVVFNVAGTGTTTLAGGAGKDIILSSSNDDTMTGNAGADTFLFGPTFGHDTITDFTSGLDKINIDTGAFADMAALLTATTLDGNGNAVITTADLANTITLQGVLTTALTANDFHFVTHA
jgi:VCBS repeat-containing protein